MAQSDDDPGPRFCPEKENQGGGLSQAMVRRIQDYMEDRLSETIDVAQLAAVAGLSPFHFSRIFRQATGSSPYQHLMQRRIARAKRLLTETDLLVTDIGFRCGFSSATHFSASFRKATGLTPLAFRNR